MHRLPRSAIGLFVSVLALIPINPVFNLNTSSGEGSPMKKLVFLTLVVFLSSTVTLDVARADRDDAPEPPPIFQTRIVNDETEPVPVVEQLKEPFNLRLVMELLEHPAGGFGADANGYRVPPDMQLTVERVSMGFNVDVGSEVDYRFGCKTDQLDSETWATHRLEPWLAFPVPGIGPHDNLVASEPIRCLVPPGGIVECHVLSSDTAALGSCAISGYLETVP